MQLSIISLLTFSFILSTYYLRPGGPYSISTKLHRLEGGSGEPRKVVSFLALLVVVTVGLWGWGLVLASTCGYMLYLATLRIVKQGRGSSVKDEQIEQLCISMINSLQAGLSLTQSLENSIDHLERPLATGLRDAMNRHQAGVRLIASLRQCAVQVRNAQLHYLVEVLAIHQDSGGQLPVLLALCAGTIRERRLAAQDLMSRTVEARLSAIVLALLPVFVGTLMALWQPESLLPLWEVPAGRTGLFIAVVCWLVGVTTIRYLINDISKEVGC